MAKRKPRAKKQTVTKIQQICDYMREFPDASTAEVMEEFDAHSSQISTARKRIGAATAESNGAATSSVDTLMRDVRTIKKMGIPQAKKVISIIETIQGG